MKISSKEDLVVGLQIQFRSCEDIDANGYTKGERKLIKALMTVYANQTESEKESGDTHCDNGVGFTPSDAKFLSSLAEQYKVKGYLTRRQIDCLKKRMPKYARQLIEGSISKGLIVKKNGFYVFGKDL